MPTREKIDIDSASFRDLYCGLMEEIKQRVVVIGDIIRSEIRLPQIVAYEVCYLQLRMICELIALACLAAHGDLLKTSSRSLFKEYNADRIMKQLQRLHPSFFPQPGRQIRNPITGKVESVENIAAGFLTKDDLLTLYGKCGNILHRGNLDRILHDSIESLDFADIRLHIDRIVTLLNHHQIQLIYEDQMFWVIMHAKEDGRVHGSLMKRVD